MEKAEFYRHALADRSGPMHGVKVLEATTAWAGPMMGCILGDLGCDVIRVDLPGLQSSSWPPFLPEEADDGDGKTGDPRPLALSHQTVNRNKRSLSLDLRQAEGCGIFLQLVAQTDIVLENFKPGTMAGWGLGYEQCKAVKHDIVYVSCSGWGQFGPWSDRAGYDPAAQAASGWMALNGTPADGPTKAPTFLADDLAGMHGAMGALAALHHRNASGEGQHVDVSLLDSLLFQSNGLLTLGAMGAELPRLGSEVAASCPTNSYTCQDGHLYLAMILDRHWQVLCGLMNRPDLAHAPGYATNVERLANRDAVNQVVAQWCAEGRVEAKLTALHEAGLAAARINSFREASQLEHLRERDMLQPTVVSGGQTVPITGPAIKFARTPTRVRRPAPDSGQHTEEILDLIGATESQRAALRQAGIIE